MNATEAVYLTVFLLIQGLSTHLIYYLGSVRILCDENLVQKPSRIQKAQIKRQYPIIITTVQDLMINLVFVVKIMRDLTVSYSIKIANKMQYSFSTKFTHSLLTHSLLTSVLTVFILAAIFFSF